MRVSLLLSVILTKIKVRAIVQLYIAYRAPDIDIGRS